MNEITRAAQVLRAGGLVAFPTETVYGLGADATSSDAMRRLYAVKGRPADHPVIVHVARAELLDDLAVDVGDAARALARAWWPGPLTLVVRRRPGVVVDEATGGRDTVAVRVPAHPVARALLDAFGGGVAAPSANRFGKVSPTTAEHVHDDLGADVDLVLDGGRCEVGVESTIVDVIGESPILLRLGGVTQRDVERVTARRVAVRTRGEIAAPGTLVSHYAPNARVEVVDERLLDSRVAVLVGECRRVAVLAPAGLSTSDPRVIALEPPRDPMEYARVLYARLRTADVLGAEVILAVPPSADGIGAAVIDRLSRAAKRGQ